MAQDHDQEGVLPLLTAGTRLREARLAAGLGLEEIAARTRVSRRHLEAIEADRFSELASRTYAVGFSRSYARALGLDEELIAQSVREELARQEELFPRAQRSENFEPGDPARVPSSSLAWVAGGGAVLLFALLFVFWRSFLAPAGSMPDLVDDKPQPVAAADRAAAPGSAATAPAPATGVVSLTALEDGVWVKVSDAKGDQLFQKELALNEAYTVPPGATGAVLATARPDKLRVMVGSRVIGMLRSQQEIVRNVPLDAASLMALPVAVPVETSTVSER